MTYFLSSIKILMERQADTVNQISFNYRDDTYVRCCGPYYGKMGPASFFSASNFPRIFFLYSGQRVLIKVRGKERNGRKLRFLKYSIHVKYCVGEEENFTL